MINPVLIALPAATGPVAILFAFHFFTRKPDMPDFTALDTATTNLSASVTRVQGLVASQSDASVQASIDSAATAVSAANDALTALAPIPAPEVSADPVDPSQAQPEG